MSKPRDVNKIFETLSILERAEVRVGWFGSEDEFGEYNAFKAEENEFGNPERNIPPRPFIFNYQADAAKTFKNFLGTLDEPRKAKRALENLGEESRKAIRMGITSVYSPKLKPKTLRLRRERGNTSAKPLMDTLSMFNTVEAKLVNV